MVRSRRASRAFAYYVEEALSIDGYYVQGDFLKLIAVRYASTDERVRCRATFLAT